MDIITKAKKLLKELKRDRAETLIKAVLLANEETRKLDFSVQVHSTGDIRLYSPKLREWLNAD